jgi:nucleoid-associated protein YgaU
MKIPQLFKHKKLLAATARRASPAGMDFENIPEPNMKLSRALLIVLLLHVVAVSGIIAFNAIKTRESSFVPPTPANAENNVADAAGTPLHGDVTKHRPAVSQREIAPRSDPKPSHSVSKDEHGRTPSSSGKTYIVKKGDNPVTIAKKLKVSYDDLIALNHIEDPHKLQIGQKLLIPAKVAKTKTSKVDQ